MIHQGDALEVSRALDSESVHCCVTSPPYWGLRDYGEPGQIGLERTPEEYVAKIVRLLAELRRVLRKDATLWLNLGDSYAADAGSDRKPTTLAGPRVPAGWTNRSQPTRIHASRRGKDCDPKRKGYAEGQPYNGSPCGGGLKPKDLCMMPARVALALQSDGWWLRSDIIWHKPNPMPESVSDRPTKAHEYVFLLAKSARYFYDAEAIKEPSVTNDVRRPYGSQGAWDMDGRPDEQKHGGEPRSFKGSRFNAGKTATHQLNRSSDLPRVHGNLPGRDDGGAACNGPGQETRNKRSVWEIPTQPFPEAHFATFPEALVEPCILAGCPEGGTVLDPFCGSGTVGVVALRHRRNFIGIELKPEYVEMARRRIGKPDQVYLSLTAQTSPPSTTSISPEAKAAQVHQKGGD